MAFFLFHWNEVNEEYISQHGVRVDEFEDVVCNPAFTGTSRSSGRPFAVGYTSTGKYIACIYEMIDETTVLPITAYDVGSE